jgi:hypothetical protein
MSVPLPSPLPPSLSTLLPVTRPYTQACSMRCILHLVCTGHMGHTLHDVCVCVCPHQRAPPLVYPCRSAAEPHKCRPITKCVAEEHEQHSTSLHIAKLQGMCNHKYNRLRMPATAPDQDACAVLPDAKEPRC